MSNGPTAIPLKEDVDAAISSVLASDDLRFGQSSPQSGSQVRLLLGVGVGVGFGGGGGGGGGSVLELMLVVVLVLCRCCCCLLFIFGSVGVVAVVAVVVVGRSVGDVGVAGDTSIGEQRYRYWGSFDINVIVLWARAVLPLNAA